ncbi:NAD(P)/FAD-dependent oxidoreductase [Candidatus Syntrophocurvum alkaliphilum]|nr:NAD(P)/FAD-dependent oxidoreductase [Candidatus Syntrophocurvum alkaliphilum]
MAPVTFGYASTQGKVTDSLIKCYEARAAGGVGLIIVEAACVDSAYGREGTNQLNIDHPRYINGLFNLSKSIKCYGSKCFIQLFHGGRQSSEKVTGNQPVAPSSIPCSMVKENPRELTKDEIENLIKKFITSAEYAHVAGFEGVELHAAHGYLINQFLSPHTNKRNDEYGGSFNNRIRFLLEIVNGIKNLPIKLALSVRINIDDFVKGGLKPDEAIKICQVLEKSGVDIIHTSCGTYESGLTSVEPVSYPEGWRVYLAEKVKKAVSIPVITGGVICSPIMANNIIAKNQADYVFLGRALLADSDWVNKAHDDKLADITPCIMCNMCVGNRFKGLPVKCSVNPMIGRVENNGEKRSINGKFKAVVIGGGPAGMQTSLSLSEKGFDVTIYEKESSLGGQLNIASIPPYKQRIKLFKENLKKRVYKSKVNVVLNTYIDFKDIAIDTDILVLATGSEPNMLDIKSNDYSKFISADDILNHKTVIKNKKVLVIGGGAVGCETAEFLLESNNVIILEQKPHLAQNMEKKNRRDLMNRLENKGLIKKVNSLIVKIDINQALINNSQKEEIIDFDYVVYAVGRTPSNEIYNKVKKSIPLVFAIGDAVEVRGIRDAMLEGYMVGEQVYYILKNK